MRQHERRCATPGADDYVHEWVVRTRPDLFIARRLPPVPLWPSRMLASPPSPMLFATSIVNGKKQACIFEGWGLMTRDVARVTMHDLFAQTHTFPGCAKLSQLSQQWYGAREGGAPPGRAPPTTQACANLQAEPPPTLAINAWP
eukprot:2308336-Prymnesium_polylepis.2